MNPAIETIILLTAFAIVAALYASVGQAGGTGYIAIMALIGFGPDIIKSTALALNILVAAIGVAGFARAGLLTWRSCYPFAILGAPFSILGGATNLPAAVYQPVVGILLLVAAWQMIRSTRTDSPFEENALANPPFGPSLVVGAVIGFVSGITGVGGGIFLAPVMLAFGWTNIRQAAATSAVFNLLNSAAALAGVWTTSPSLPAHLPWWLMAAGVGGLLGSWLGLRHLSPTVLRVILAALLIAAGVRMLLT